MKSRLIAALFSLTWLAGCLGGSGSSGFDISPAAENRNIDQAVAEQRCIEENGLSICPAGQTFQSVPAIPEDMQPANQDILVTVTREQVDITGCSTAVCAIQIGLSPQGIPLDARYQLAVRPSGSDVWNVGESITTDELQAGITPSAPIAASAIDAPRQLAVLVYFDREPTVSGTLDTLHESGAELVFID